MPQIMSNEPGPGLPGHTTTFLAGQALAETRTRAERHGALFERVVDRIHRYFGKLVWSADEAEELLQRTLLELERSLREKTYDPARSFNAWMWLKAHTQFCQWARERARRMASMPADEPADPREDARGAVERRLDAEAILRRVQERLGDEVYEVFVLYYEAGLTQAEVGEAVGLHPKTVRKRLAQAHELIDAITGSDTGGDGEDDGERGDGDGAEAA